MGHLLSSGLFHCVLVSWGESGADADRSCASGGGSPKRPDDSKTFPEGSVPRSARRIAPHTCMRSDIESGTMMQQCASEAKLRAAGPFFRAAHWPCCSSGHRRLGVSEEPDESALPGSD